MKDKLKAIGVLIIATILLVACEQKTNVKKATPTPTPNPFLT